MSTEKHHSFFYKNGLGIVSLTLFAFTLLAQAVTGWHEHNAELAKEGAAAISLGS